MQTIIGTNAPPASYWRIADSTDPDSRTDKGGSGYLLAGMLILPSLFQLLLMSPTGAPTPTVP
jgi:hypothetical protein